jgi:hypothetical protein
MLLLCGLLLGAVAGEPMRAALEQATQGRAPTHAAATHRGHDTAAWLQVTGDAGTIPLGHLSTGVRVARYVELVLAPRVRALEAAALTANEQVLAYCDDPGLVRVDCTELPSRPHAETALDLLRALAPLATSFSATGQALWQDPPPTVGDGTAAPLACLVEDLSLFAGGYARLLAETAQDIPSIGDKAPVAPVEYAARVRSLVVLLDRAERWLETVDPMAHTAVSLPGFEDGGRSLDGQLSMTA